MNRITERFAALRERGEKALVTFITAGDPDLAATEAVIPVLEQAGADIIELGVPFSDPMADGPTIQLSSERALKSGTTLAGILEMVARVRKVSQVPLLLMGYYNPILMYGEERFAADAAAAGVDGVLVVDVPPEEAQVLRTVVERAGIHLIHLLTPTSDESRLRKVLPSARGFVYYVSVTGVTGARRAVSGGIADSVAAIRKMSSVPVAVGFGISTPEQAREVAAAADGVVVGSALVKLFEGGVGPAFHEEVARYIRSLKEAVAGI